MVSYNLKLASFHVRSEFIGSISWSSTAELLFFFFQFRQTFIDEIWLTRVLFSHISHAHHIYILDVVRVTSVVFRQFMVCKSEIIHPGRLMCHL